MRVDLGLFQMAIVFWQEIEVETGVFLRAHMKCLLLLLSIWRMSVLAAFAVAANTLCCQSVSALIMSLLLLSASTPIKLFVIVNSDIMLSE